MNTNRTIADILYAGIFDMGGMPVRQAFPASRMPHVDPFILLHHAEVKVPTGKPIHKIGVGPHPHRGFSPVTFIFKGGVHHRDSAGHDQTVYAGGAQWMHAGKGVIHSERPADDIFDIGGRQEIIQLWVNSPAKHKMDEPSYFPVNKGDIPTIKSDDGKVEIHLVAGELLGKKGPVPPLTQIIASTLEIEEGGEMFIPLPLNHQAFIYLLDGKVLINGLDTVEGKNAVVFHENGDGITIRGLENTRALLMSGVPINERIVSHGPFVMNTNQEIAEAMDDFYAGKMGVLKD